MEKTHTLPYAVWFDTSASPDLLDAASDCILTGMHLACGAQDRPSSMTYYHTFLVPGLETTGGQAVVRANYVAFSDEVTMLNAWTESMRAWPQGAVLTGIGVKTGFTRCYINRCIIHRIESPAWMSMTPLDRFNTNRGLAELMNVYTQGSTRTAVPSADELLRRWRFAIPEYDHEAMLEQIKRDEPINVEPIRARLDAIMKVYELYRW